MYKTIDRLSTELEDIKEKYEEVRSAKQEAVRELLTLQQQHKAELRILTNSQIEEANARENLERKLSELRSEVCIAFQAIVEKSIASSCVDVQLFVI